MHSVLIDAMPCNTFLNATFECVVVKGGCTALMLAASYGYDDVVRLLVEKGARQNIKNEVKYIMTETFLEFMLFVSVVLIYFLFFNHSIPIGWAHSTFAGGLLWPCARCNGVDW